MVVLDPKGMLTAGSNQYLQPDYLSPLTTTLDSKKSPLALLAQTCSQIGADSSKPISSSDKKKDEEKKDKSTPSPVEVRHSPAFKPYETSRKDESGDEKPTGRSSGHGGSGSNHSSTPGHQSSGQRPSSASSNAGSAKEDGRRSNDLTISSSASTTPIIRSGLEVLAGHPKDVPLGTYRPGVHPFLPPSYPGFESHPAFRGAHPGLFGGGFMPGLSLASTYSGAAAALYSSCGLTSAGLPSSLSSGLTSSLASSLAGGIPASLLASPYVNYTRVKTGGGGEAIVPVCRDPFCQACPYSLQNNHLLQSGGACPPSCTQCEQAKAALSALPGLGSIPPSSLVPASSLLPPSASSLYAPPATAASILGGSATRPYVCNWIAGDAYCGKRFANSEELLQHLRSHTSATSESALSLLSNPLHAHAALLGSAAQSLHRPGAPYPPPSLSPLTAARYHPYGKPGGLSAASALSPSLAGLSPYSHLSAAAGYPPGYPYASLYPRPPL